MKNNLIKSSYLAFATIIAIAGCDKKSNNSKPHTSEEIPFWYTADVKIYQGTFIKTDSSMSADSNNNPIFVFANSDTTEGNYFVKYVGDSIYISTERIDGHYSAIVTSQDLDSNGWHVDGESKYHFVNDSLYFHYQFTMEGTKRLRTFAGSLK